MLFQRFLTLIMTLTVVVASARPPLMFAPTPSGLIISGGLGASRINDADHKTLIISPYIFDRLHQSARHDSPSYRFSVAKNFPLRNHFSLTLGPSLYYQRQQSVGNVWELNLPKFNNYHYSLESRNLILLFETEMNWQTHTRVTPYISVGGGLVVADTSYKEHARQNIPQDSEFAISSCVQVKPAGALGGGFHYSLNDQLAFSLRYNFFALGKAHTGHETVNRLQGTIPVELNSNNVFLTLDYRT